MPVSVPEAASPDAFTVSSALRPSEGISRSTRLTTNPWSRAGCRERLAEMSPLGRGSVWAQPMSTSGAANSSAMTIGIEGRKAGLL